MKTGYGYSSEFAVNIWEFLDSWLGDWVKGDLQPKNREFP
jgi:hypothetical protein